VTAVLADDLLTFFCEQCHAELFLLTGGDSRRWSRGGQGECEWEKTRTETGRGGGWNGEQRAENGKGERRPGLIGEFGVLVG
jgi:hypothetical protein